jgi:N-carbamoylputrescine amidase
MACSWDTDANVDRAEALVRQAASQGANVVLIQELFQTPYFCAEQKNEYRDLARPLEGHPVIARMQELARELQVVMPVSFFEKANTALFNTVAIVDADGSVLGKYRKSHIPDAIGYQEKFYFSPGDTGFRVWHTAAGCIGVGICWDQWFPEAAPAMTLMGAEILLYPTAIGCEPRTPEINSRAHWTRVMQGHAAANVVAVAASNRIGKEIWDTDTMNFYGGSFIAGPEGEICAQASEDREEIITTRFDLDVLRSQRLEWGIFRDRRPDLYQSLGTLDGAA